MIFRSYNIFLILLLRRLHRRVSSKHWFRNIAIYLWTHLFFCSSSRAALKCFSKLRNLFHFSWAFSKIYYKISVKLIKKFLSIELNTNCLILLAFGIELFLIILSYNLRLLSAVIYEISMSSHVWWRCNESTLNIFAILYF